MSDADRAVERELGGLALSAARVLDPLVLARATLWRSALGRLGVRLPLWVVHDLGALAVVEPGALDLGPRVDPPFEGAALAAHAAWVAAVQELAESQTLTEARRARLRDELVAVLLLRALLPVLEAATPTAPEAPLPLDPERYRQSPEAMRARFAAHDRTAELALVARLGAARLRLLMAVEHVDLGTLELLGLFGADALAGRGAEALVDLLAVFQSREATDVVAFALDLLPSVLETRRAAGEQIFSVDGYAGVERRGGLDSLVMTELALDDGLFEQRWVDGELLHYTREKQQDEERRLHYLLVDATAGMRGLRSTFARGLALALAKKLLLRGEEVWYRFFDSRLHDVRRARRGGPRREASGLDVPYLLGFKGERGRNYAKVFGLVAAELERLGRRRSGTPIVYVLTHAECHVPLETVERLRQLARLYGVFLLPSTGELDLDYVGKLHAVQVVDHAALGVGEARARRALSIVEDATAF